MGGRQTETGDRVNYQKGEMSRNEIMQRNRAEKSQNERKSDSGTKLSAV